MDEQYPPVTELQVDESAQAALRDTAKWTRFLAITSFVLMGLMLLALVFMFAFKGSLSKAFSSNPELSQLGDMGTNVFLSVIAFAVVIALAIFAFITYILMRFSAQTAKGIDQQDQVAFESGIASLKTYMIINGVFAIIGLIAGLFQLLIFI